MKTNNGVTLITVIVMIIIIIILASVFIATGLDSLNETKKGKVINETYQIKEAISDEYTNFLKNLDTATLIGTLAKTKWSNPDDCINKIKASLNDEDFENAEDRSKKETKIEDDIKRDYDQYVMIIDSKDKQKLGLENYSEDMIYIVNYNTNSVYGPWSTEDF